jgi:EAL domain-containing protein (putative c-di-GMP-specific phosphodiesterase class I)
LATTWGWRVIAEGVETEAQREFLTRQLHFFQALFARRSPWRVEAYIAAAQGGKPKKEFLAFANHSHIRCESFALLMLVGA